MAIKVRHPPFFKKKISFACFNESPLKVTKNTFHFKLRYLNFCHELFAHVGKRIDKKAQVNFEIHDVMN